MKKIILLLMCVTIFNISCNNNSNNTLNDKSEFISSFNQLLDEYYEDWLKLNPLDATEWGDNRHNSSFHNTLSDEFKTKTETFYNDYLKKITQFNDEDLSESEKISKALILWECDMYLKGLSINQEYFPIKQLWTINSTIGQYASGTGVQPFNTIDDYNNWLKRLDGYLIWMASAESKMKEGIERGYVLPKSLILKVIPQLEVFTTKDIDQHVFYKPVKNFPETFSNEEKELLINAYTQIITEKIIPAYTSLHKFMSTEYLEAGRETSGVGALPNGKTYYDYMIKYYTSTNISADEIYQLGLSEVARISKEIEKIKDELGFTGDQKAFFEYLRNKKELMPFSDPQQVIDYFNSIHERMKPQLERLFDLKPKMSFEVRRTEAFREKSAPFEYVGGSEDGKLIGIFYVPIPDVTKFNIVDAEAIFLHEAIPGHHYQLSLQRENSNLPNFRRNSFRSAYGEGWALYTESLGKELGLYTNPYQYLGMLNMDMLRAVRLVVDVGIHAKGWTREQAIEYSLNNLVYDEEKITSEIERYMAHPGQALSYKIGQLKIRELRTKAEKELGDNFDIQEFHNKVLETGSLPLEILEERIDNWIASKK